MTGDRSEEAVRRIEAALARIARVADAPVAKPTSDGSGQSANVLALVEQHESLRETVAQSLADLDALIAEIDQ